MNGILFGFEFMCGVALFLFVAWSAIQSRTVRDWLWLSPVLVAAGYLLIVALGLTK